MGCHFWELCDVSSAHGACPNRYLAKEELVSVWFLNVEPEWPRTRRDVRGVKHVDL